MDNVVKDKSFAFAIRVIGLYKHLSTEKHEYVMSRQLLKSGTSIGAQIREAEFGQSKADFLSKMSIALKETNETEYWFMLLKETDYIENKEFDSIHEDCVEILRLLISIVKSTKNGLGK